eukprot:2850347-Rhodomonas_salina.4
MITATVTVIAIATATTSIISTITNTVVVNILTIAPHDLVSWVTWDAGPGQRNSEKAEDNTDHHYMIVTNNVMHEGDLALAGDLPRAGDFPRGDLAGDLAREGRDCESR